MRYFNTTLVSVRQSWKIDQLQLQLHFNTTLVSVRQRLNNREFIKIKYFNTTLVSVRPGTASSSRMVRPISIQHLFRFDVLNLVKRCFLTNISIQHLFRFDKVVYKEAPAAAPFQYNTCFGSTSSLSRSSSTNSISIQHLFRFDLKELKNRPAPKPFQYNTCFGSTRCYQDQETLNEQFQYNTCFGSTLKSIGRSYKKEHFNTTLVSVRPLFLFLKFKVYRISIQHLFRFDNTRSNRTVSYSSFQYNTCFGSTSFPIEIKLFFLLFQYNTCFGSTHIKPVVNVMIVEFQYNTCFGSTVKCV